MRITQMKKCLLIMILILCAHYSYTAAEEEPLFIAQEGWKQGFINAEGEWVIDPVYTKVWPFTDAGYAAVETEEAPLRSSFKLINKQGKLVADLPDWWLDYSDYSDEYDAGGVRQNAVGQAFVLHSRNDSNLSALYLADTGEFIELDQAFLEYNLTPGAEINAMYMNIDYLETNEIRPYMFYLLDWNDRMVLAFKYADYHKGLRGSAEAHVIEKDYCSGFVILDRNGRKIHDGYFNGSPDALIEDDTEKYRITSSFLLTGNNRTYEDHSLRNLIDRDGKTVLEGLPEYSRWDEAAQAVYLESEDVAILTNGDRISREEYIIRLAQGNTCGITTFRGKYYNSQGKPVSWYERYTDGLSAKSEFGNRGLSWACFTSIWDDGCLINTEGTIVVRDIIPGYSPDQPAAPAFPDGWECVESANESGVGYINDQGELMYSRYPFNYAEPFKNGLAHVQVMDEQFKLLNAYINSSGRIVWAEQGRKDDIQRWLDQNECHTVSDMTVDDARRTLVGEWDCSGGGEFIGYPIIFYENGTCNIGAKRILKWDVLENTAGAEYFWDSPQFALVFGDEKGFETLEEGTGLSFGSTNRFYLTDYDGGCSYDRMASGYWERNGYHLEADEDGNLDVWWAKGPVLPKEPLEFGLTDSKRASGDTGILAFRDSSYRQNAAADMIKSIEQPKMIWQADIGSASTQEEINWQPLIANWSDEIRNAMKSLVAESSVPSLKEVIAIGTDGMIHFLDLMNGNETRSAIGDTDAGLHGTGTVPSGFPILFVPAKEGFVCYDLTDCSRLTAADEFLRSYYNPGENILYQDGWLLMDNGYTQLVHITIQNEFDPEYHVQMSDIYQTDYPDSWNNDVPACADGSFIYTVSASDLIRRDTMTDQKADWAKDTFWASSNINSTAAIDHPQGEWGTIYLGTSEIWSRGTCSLYCINAETMENVWQISYVLDDTLPLVGGVLSAPVIGQEGLVEMVYFTITGLRDDEGEARLVAVRKDTGNVVWSLPMQTRTVSSPVAVYTEEGKGYLIQVDGNGVMHVADGLTGELLYSYELGGAVTTSPAVYRNMLVIRCQKDGREMLCGVRIGE